MGAAPDPELPEFVHLREKLRAMRYGLSQPNRLIFFDVPASSLFLVHDAGERERARLSFPVYINCPVRILKKTTSSLHLRIRLSAARAILLCRPRAQTVFLGEAHEIYFCPSCSHPAFDNTGLLRRSPHSKLRIYEREIMERLGVRGTYCLLFNRRRNPDIKAARLC